MKESGENSNKLKKIRNKKQYNMCHKQLETNFPDLTKEFGNINKD